MKKKGPRSIPDFSPKRSPPRSRDLPAAKPAEVPAPRVPIVKPPAGSAKLGRRGQ